MILSLENHCSVDQQKLMAHHMISILGDALLSKPLGNTMPANFPSPEVGTLYYQLIIQPYLKPAVLKQHADTPIPPIPKEVTP